MAARSGRRRYLLLTLLLVLVGHIHARHKPSAELSTLDRVLLAVTGPMEKAVSGVGQGTEGLFRHYLVLVGVSRRNVELEEALLTAHSHTAELEELRAENDRLREIASLRVRTPGATVGATVIGRGTTARFRTLRVDRGTEDGVLVGCPVIAPAGAVGQILRAGEAYADVLLLTDELSGVGAVVQRSRLRGVMAGDGDRGLRLGFVRRSDQGALAAGDEVVSSGEDGVFPPGLALGSVLVVGAPQTGLFLEVEVTPAVELDRLDEVLIITHPGAGPWASPRFSADPASSRAPAGTKPGPAIVGPALPPGAL